VYLNDVQQLLTDPAFDRTRRLLRLQGQRGPMLEKAVASGWAMRLGPGQCAFFGTLAIAFGQPRAYVLLAALSSIGVLTSHHPVEWLYVWWARRHGRPSPPPNRAPRRFACLLGAGCFLVAGLALSTGTGWIFWPTALTLVALPTFVATTNVCLPSVLFTLVVGADRATCPSLWEALAPGRGWLFRDSGSRTSRA
jgi:hypothetical protein